MIKLDQLDKTLISILRSDARTPVVKLAKQLNVSRATIQNRMQLLESRGIILNYTVNLKNSAKINPIRAFMSIAVEGTHDDPPTPITQGFMRTVFTCVLH